ncbi:MAG: flagellar hook capping FlgD N-terminal domain-containing protein [Syntrophales bacterium]
MKKYIPAGANVKWGCQKLQTLKEDEIMSISAVSSSLLGVSQTTAATTETTSASEDFLTILLAQLKYQDPTDPTSTSELTSQLASLSQLEESVTTNSYLDTLAQYGASSANADALGCIGKTVSTDDITDALVTSVSFKDGVAYLGTDSGEIAFGDVTGVSST